MESHQDFHARIESHREAQTCSVCGHHLDYSQGYYSLEHAHSICVFPDRRAETLTSIFAKGDAALAALGCKPTRKPVGLGKSAMWAKALAVQAIETQLGAELFDITLWSQQGAYRGACWDLDAWGIDFAFHSEGQTLRGCASSLARMGQYKKRAMVTPKDGVAWGFDIHPFD